MVTALVKASVGRLALGAGRGWGRGARGRGATQRARKKDARGGARSLAQNANRMRPQAALTE